MSPGLFAAPSGRFSERRHDADDVERQAPSRRQAAIVPNTLAPPHMSYFISSIAAAGLIEMPPASNVSPLPTSATGLLPAFAPAFDTPARSAWRARRLPRLKPTAGRPCLSSSIGVFGRAPSTVRMRLPRPSGHGEGPLGQVGRGAHDCRAGCPGPSPVRCLRRRLGRARWPAWPARAVSARRRGR
jgi:hypothetical protein